jgi:putative ABC transport system permease protein
VPLEREVDEEIDLHVEMRIRELVDRGVEPRVARDQVLNRIGDVRHLKRTCVDIGRRRDRQMRASQWLDELRHDVTFALRQMRTAPGFAAIAIITLALGIGANSAMFALADAALLRPLPVAEPDRHVMVWDRRDGVPRGLVNPADFLDWTERNRTFDAMAAFLASGAAMTGADGMAEALPAQVVTPRFFEAVGVAPRAGRTFVEGDARIGDVVVLSEAFWRQRFGADPGLVGQAITLDGRPFTVIGIVPPDVRLDAVATGGDRPQLWRLMSLADNRGPAQRYAHYLRVVGRLRPGVSHEAAQADVSAVAASIARETPATNAGHDAVIEPLAEWAIGGELRLTALLLLGVTAFVLLTCCANVANLLLARTTARARELAVRSSLGAGRRRIARQLLTESLVLAACGGLLGAGIGWGLLRAAPAIVPAGLLPPAVTLGFDVRILAFCGLSAIVVAVAFGLAPIWQATGASPTQAMAHGGRTATGHASRLRHALAGAEIAMAVLLLCGGGLLLRTLLALEDVDSGSRASNLLTMAVNAPMQWTPEARSRYYQDIAREVATSPGVRDLAWGSALPLDGLWYGQAFHIEDGRPRAPVDRDSAGYQIVSPSYFDLLGIETLEGRGFTDRDTAEAPQVCLVNEAFVRRYLDGRQPLGLRLSVNAMAQPPVAIVREIVGVVAQVKESPDQVDDSPQIYVPLEQNAWSGVTLVVAPEDGPAAALTPTIRAAVARVDPDQPVRRVRTLDAIGHQATARPRFRAVLVGAFAALGLTLAMIGVFGVLAYSVQQRTREFGIRIALGATARHVLALVCGGAGRVVAAGVAAGLLAAAVSGRALASFLFQVEPLDPLTFSVVAVVLVLTAGVATLVPALRATRADPAVTLRGE